MKRIVVFLLSFSLLVIVSIFGTGNYAFAGHYPPFSPEVVVLICSVTTPSTTSALTFTVTAFSSSTTSVKIGLGDDCATDLVALENAGLGIRDIQALTSSTPASVVYTLVNGLYY